MHAVDLRYGLADRSLELLGDVVRGLERHVARQLQMQRELGAAADHEQCEVVDFAHAGHGDRGSVRTLADARVLERLDVHDDVATRQRSPDRGLDRVRGRVPLPDAADGETPITTSAN